MHALAFALVFAVPPALKPWILRALVGAKVGRRVSIGWFSSVSGRQVELGDGCVIRALSLIRCDGDVRIGRYAEVSSFCLVYGCAGFTLGDKSYVGPQSLINASEDVRIGNVSAIGPRAQVFTHGSFLPYTEGYWVKFAPVVVGDRVWTGAGCFLHPGTEIGDDVFVNAASVLTGRVPSGAVMEGNPARQVSRIEKLRRTVTPQRRDGLIATMLAHLGRFLTMTRADVAIVDHGPGHLTVRIGRRSVRLLVVASDAAAPPAGGDSGTLIALVNATGVGAGLAARGATVFDFTTMRAHHAGRGLADEVYLFFKRYYGVVFERE